MGECGAWDERSWWSIIIIIIITFKERNAQKRCQHNFDLEEEVSTEKHRLPTVYLLLTFVVKSIHTNTVWQ